MNGYADRVHSLMLSAIALAMLAGCQGMKYAMDNYNGVKMQRFKMPVENPGDDAAEFRIFDRPEDGRLSMGSVAAMGTARGLTFGLAGPHGGLAPSMREGAEAYLASTGRTCAVASVDLIVEPQYEVVYRCDLSVVDG